MNDANPFRGLYPTAQQFAESMHQFMTMMGQLYEGNDDELEWVKTGTDPLRYEYGLPNHRPELPPVTNARAYVEREPAGYFKWKVYRGKGKSGAQPTLQSAQEMAMEHVGTTPPDATPTRAEAGVLTADAARKVITNLIELHALPERADPIVHGLESAVRCYPEDTERGAVQAVLIIMCVAASEENVREAFAMAGETPRFPYIAR